MPTRRPVHVADDATTIRETNRFLKMPHSRPTTDEQHAANVRELERWGNRIPLGGDSDDCCFCWRNDTTSGVPLLTDAESTYIFNVDIDPVEYASSPSLTEVDAIDVHVRWGLTINNTIAPGEYYTLSAIAFAGIMAGTDSSSRTVLPLYAPNDPSGTTDFTGEHLLHVFPAAGTSLTVMLDASFHNDTGSVTALPSLNGYIEVFNKKTCGLYVSGDS